MQGISAFVHAAALLLQLQYFLNCSAAVARS
jgi:hypothetical protein